MAKYTGVSGQRKEAGVGAIIWNIVAKKPEAFHHGQQSELIELNVIEARVIPSSPDSTFLFFFLFFLSFFSSFFFFGGGGGGSFYGCHKTVLFFVAAHVAVCLAV